MRGRPPGPEADRKIKMSVRVRPTFKNQFNEVAARRGLSPAEAQRQAMQHWVTREG
jgi:hypothetical protein